MREFREFSSSLARKKGADTDMLGLFDQKSHKTKIEEEKSRPRNEVGEVLSDSAPDSFRFSHLRQHSSRTQARKIKRR